MDDDKLASKVSFYHDQVWSDTPFDFLRSRGLSHSTVVRFHLGYVGDLQTWHDRHRRGCLVLPYEDGAGRVRSVRYRPLYQLPDGAPKYLTTTGDRAHIFAVRATDNPVVHVCEGEIDTMTLWQIGLRAVGIPGAGAWKPDWKWLFRNTERVVLCMDPDPAGERATINLLKDLRSITDVDVAQLPRGVDVNDYLLKYGEDQLRRVVS
jgi:hypothetical protein